MGGFITIKSLWGEEIVKVEKAHQSGDIILVKGKGLPDMNNSTGDLFLKTFIKVPYKLDDEGQKIVKGLKKYGS